MPDTGEDDVLAASELRSSQRLLAAGIAAILVLTALSAALGVYAFNLAQSVSATSRALQREAFDARIRADQQNNRVRAQEIAIRRIYDEVALGGGASARPGAALDAVRIYLQRGHRTLAGERAIEAAAEGGAAGPAQQLVLGGAALLEWERSGEQIQPGAGPLPEPLAAAERAFNRARTDRALAPLAHNGIAWVRYLLASSPKSNFAQADCEAVFTSVTASAAGGAPGPQPLFWRAQCERKLGRTREALRDYRLALGDMSDGAARAPDEAELTRAMNAYHGMGTVLIALFDAEDDAEMRAALELAARACGPGAEGDTSPRMRLALACLDRAIALRGRLQQTENQISGSGENKGFAYLRDGDYASAFHNAAIVERTGLFAWNELVRALSAGRLRTPEAIAARQAALRNISFFQVAQFNVCELRALLSREMFAEAQKLIGEQHKGEAVACA